MACLPILGVPPVLGGIFCRRSSVKTACTKMLTNKTAMPWTVLTVQKEAKVKKELMTAGKRTTTPKYGAWRRNFNQTLTSVNDCGNCSSGGLISTRALFNAFQYVTLTRALSSSQPLTTVLVEFQARTTPDCEPKGTISISFNV